MHINPLTPNERDAAIDEIESLWNAKPDSEDEEGLGMLAVSVLDYEDKHYMQDTQNYKHRCRNYLIGIICAWSLIHWVFPINNVFTIDVRLFISHLLYMICFWRLVYLTRR